ncbi:hypothetical protein BS78_04G315200, partial [Paspalum vaginatum]
PPLRRTPLPPRGLPIHAPAPPPSARHHPVSRSAATPHSVAPSPPQVRTHVQRRSRGDAAGGKSALLFPSLNCPLLFSLRSPHEAALSGPISTRPAAAPPPPSPSPPCALSPSPPAKRDRGSTPAIRSTTARVRVAASARRRPSPQSPPPFEVVGVRWNRAVTTSTASCTLTRAAASASSTLARPSAADTTSVRQACPRCPPPLSDRRAPVARRRRRCQTGVPPSPLT